MREGPPTVDGAVTVHPALCPAEQRFSSSVKPAERRGEASEAGTVGHTCFSFSKVFTEAPMVVCMSQITAALSLKCLLPLDHTGAGVIKTDDQQIQTLVFVHNSSRV